MKDIEIVEYTEYPWGSIIKIKHNNKFDYMVSAKVGTIVGSMSTVAILAFAFGLLYWH